jgi:hypothetical protein
VTRETGPGYLAAWLPPRLFASFAAAFAAVTALANAAVWMLV